MKPAEAGRGGEQPELMGRGGDSEETLKDRLVLLEPGKEFTEQLADRKSVV